MKNGFMLVIIPLFVFSICAGSSHGRMLEQSGTPQGDSLYSDLSEKGDCIRNYERSCNERNIDRYSELFQDDCEFIIMMGKPDSVANIFAGEILRKVNLENELKTTRLLFAGVQELHLELEQGMWTRLDSLGGEPCAECWETIRSYSLSASFAASGQGGEPHVMTGQGHMQFLVSPVNGKWKIFRHIDEPINE